MSKNAKEKSAAPAFSKEQLYNSKRYEGKQDLVMALLDDGRTYTIEEVETLINNFMNKEVM